MCAEIRATPLLLVIFGSELYGTSLPDKSDTDIRGIFLPSAESLLLQRAASHLQFSTGDPQSRNTQADFDISLWSLQKWLLELLPRGDISAIDLLFSTTHKDCILLESPLLAPVFANPLRYLNLSDPSECTRYIIRQTKKYGIRGSRLGALKRVRNFLKENPVSQDTRLGAIFDDIIGACNDSQCCARAETPDGTALRLGGRLHVPGITVTEFSSRVERELSHYKDAGEPAGIDFKALSHAARAADQMEELLTTGHLEFPLKTAPELIRIKTGQYTWNEIEPLLLKRLDDVKRLGACHRAAYDPSFAINAILDCYKRSEGNFVPASDLCI